ncbi:MAG: ABC transporter ATP-binding protein [Leptospiraceae bacterium]|nr:ABC transporter ATP-binding protein [Leptospiraceae bacterium]MCP5497144.1 ABC transporter ATP-binding protein [Leptospiraceae bacterium]
MKPETLIQNIEFIAKNLAISLDHSLLRGWVRAREQINSELEVEVFIEIANQSGIGIIQKQAEISDITNMIKRGVPVIFPVRNQKKPEILLLLKDKKNLIKVLDFSEQKEQLISQSELGSFLKSNTSMTDNPYMILSPEPLSPYKNLEHSNPNGRFEIIERLISFIKLDKRDVFAILIYGMMSGLFNLIVPISTASLINTIAMETLVQPLVVLTLSLFIFLALSGFMKVMQTIATEIIQKRTMVRLSFEFLYKIAGVDREKAKNTYIPELSNRIFEVSSLQKGVELLLIDGLASILTIIIGLMVMAFYHSVFLVFDIFIFTYLYAVVFLPLKSGYVTGIKQSKQKYRIAHWIQEIAKKPGTLSDSSKTARERLEDLNRDYVYYRDKYFAILIRHLIGLHSLKAIGSAIVLGLGGFLVIQNQLTLGQLVAAELIIMTVMGEFSKMGKYVEVSYDMLASLDKISHVIDLPSKDHKSNLPSNPKSPIEINLINLKLPELSSQNLNFLLKAGQSYGIASDPEIESSTLLDILSNRQSSVSGQVLLNQTPIQTISQTFLEKRICLLRKIEVFEGSILDNILCGNIKPMDDVILVLKKLGLLDEVNRFTEGIHTILKPNGKPLSTRQLKILMITRILISEPGLVLIDGFLESFEEREVIRILDVLKDFPFTLVVNSNHKVILENMQEVWNFGV